MNGKIPGKMLSTTPAPNAYGPPCSMMRSVRETFFTGARVAGRSLRERAALTRST